MSIVTEVSSAKCFGGQQKVFKHDSKELKCQMNFSIFLPPKVLDGKKAPVLYWLSGLTCTEQNFIIKSGFQRYAAESGLIVVGPDTSPRGVDIPGQDDDWDFGSGAGFYINATQPSWKEHYRMYSYVTEELPSLIESQFSDYVLPGRKSISGHSMGGHGALICSLKNPGAYISVSAFAPINNPSKVPWGIKAFKGYLGGEVGGDGSIPDSWKEWDATFLAAAYTGSDLQLLVDQGSSDPYLSEQLDGKNFISSCASANLPLVYRIQDGYDHGYFFVSTFIEEHIKHHAKWLYGQ